MFSNVRVYFAAAVLLAFGLAGTQPTLAQDGGLCATPGNLTKNCSFDGFRSQPGPGFDGVANNWNAFVISGTPQFLRSDHSPQADCQQIWSQGGLWDAGVFQQVAVSSGQGYRAELGWFAPYAEGHAGNVGRIGIDLQGGTNPSSAGIVWSPWTILSKGLHYQTKATATGNTLTVFVEAKFQDNIVNNIVFIDAVILVPDASAPPPPGPPPTPTSPPAPPTDTPRPTATRTATRPPAPSNTPRPTSTNTAAPTAAPTVVALAPTETATATPSDTPTATASPTRRPTLTPTPTPDFVQSNLDVIGLGLVSLSACALFAAVSLGVFAYWFWKRK